MSKALVPSVPPQTIMFVPVQIAVWNNRPEGALAVLVLIQVFESGLYLPPVSRFPKTFPVPPQTIIALPVQTAVWMPRASGALVILVGAQLSELGLYLPPVFK